ncbi:thiamine pyrophosphate-dependent enzyme [Pseudodesulfovibrio sp.]|uniref:thiamine pyrophosphate-dependent enzyme n=1 Tax=Pseudodesulfovibrio sp. TaxID=2035812 RepID=UPI002635D7A8|nr:thiamine pyrophosphate-dependent enzyme [Pseudodesulfovibrio sp.]MDD3311229.1 thiamine pyrophosphate-dependent enzyme [Pseudodesulfovibrio sp.]
MSEKLTPKLLVEPNKFCPGCGHGIINRVLAEVLEESGLADQAVGALAVGCACLMMDTFGTDWVQAPHGRAAAVAVGVKRMRPECCVFTYQGDGDSMSIGFSETLYAAIRNENITAILVNNGIFGMTGGQMAPTSLPGQKTTTSPKGRDAATTGQPLNMIDQMKHLPIGYLARGSVASAKDINNLKKYIKTAIETQMNGGGYSMVEVLSFCPTNWKMNMEKSVAHVQDTVKAIFPVGEFVKNGERTDA